MPQNTSNKRRAVTIHPPARLVGEPKETKKEKKKDTQNSGKLAIRPYHPRRRIKIKLSLVGGLRCVVIRVNKCDPNRLRGYGAVGGRKWPFPITLASGLYNSLYYRTSRDKAIFKMAAIRRLELAKIAVLVTANTSACDHSSLFQISR